MNHAYIKLPSFIVRKKIGKNEIVRIITLDTEVLIEKADEETIIAINSHGNKINIHRGIVEARENEQYVLVTVDKPSIEKISTGEQKLKWVRHPCEELSVEQITRTWHNGIILREETKDEPGLRAPQLGAIYAALAHWTVSNDIATIVMPTGTGKTETMLSLLISAQCERLLVTVPSDSLRGQLSEKFEILGFLKKFQLVLSKVELPIVGILQERFKTEEELRDFISQCNIIITTMSNVAGYSNQLQNCFSELCPYYFIDEAHHTTAKTWMDFIQRFNKSKVLQFTATPFRNDGVKLNGKIIYNYSLRKAQEEHYFTKITFNPIFEIDKEKADFQIANEAIKVLEKQEASGYTKQIIMARCEDKKHAHEVYEIYRALWQKYNPVIIYSGSGLSECDRNEAIYKLKNGIAKIVVCVDMLGEGFDLPTLKIAALHYIKKSLTVTLQLIGRFTRTKFDEDLGDATFVANIADLSVSEELERLYAQNADWNELLPEMSTSAISQEINFDEFIKGFSLPRDLNIPLQNLRPALSTVVYRNPKNAWHYDCYLNGITLNEGDRTWSIVNSEENILLIVIVRKQQVDWGNIQELENIIWDLLIVINDIENKLLYINGSDNNGLYSALAEAIIGEKAIVIKQSNPFKAFYGVNRVRLQNVGLKQIVGRNIRFRMSVGTDVAEALSIAEKSGGQKAFIVGSGYENGRKVTLGCSYKGRIWTLLTGNVHSLANWCKSIGRKVINPDIDGDQILKETLIPELIDKIPDRPYAWIDWNEDVYNFSESKMDFLRNGHSYNLCDTSINLNLEKSNKDTIAFYLEFCSPNGEENQICEITMSLGSKEGNAFSEYTLQADQPKIVVRLGKREWPIEEFFQSYEPSIWFVDGSCLCGNEYIQLKQAPGIYPIERMEGWDWSAVDISKESQHVGTLRTDSIQHHVIQELLQHDYDIIYDDDNSGEMADVIAIKETNDFIDIELYHLKFAKDGVISQRIDNLYEVCGQAQKSVHWNFKDSREFFSHLYKRQIKTYKGKKGSRIIKGDMKELQRLDRLARVKLPLRFKISIVQPGLSVTNPTLEQRTLLSVTEKYLMDVANIPLYVIANKD